MLSCPLGNGELRKQGWEMIPLALRWLPFSSCVEVPRSEERLGYTGTAGKLATQGILLGISVSPGSMWEMQALGHHLAGLNHLNEIPRWLVCTVSQRNTVSRPTLMTLSVLMQVPWEDNRLCSFSYSTDFQTVPWSFQLHFGKADWNSREIFFGIQEKF